MGDQQEPKPLVFSETVKERVMTKEPGALSFPTTSAQPATAKSSEKGPGALSFPTTSVPPSPAKKDPVGPKPLDLSATRTVAVKAPTKAVAPAQTAFSVNKHPLCQHAIEIAKTNFASAFANDSFTIEKQIQQLLGAFDLATISTWAANHLTAQMQISAQCASLIKQHAQMRLDEVISEALSTVNKKGNLLDRLLRPTNSSLQHHKAQLMVAQTQIATMTNNCQAMRKQISEIGEKLVNRMVAMASVREAFDTQLDTSLELAISNRCNLLQTAVTQNQMMTAQLQQILQHFTTTSPQIDQFLTVTLPAIEMANASKI